MSPRTRFLRPSDLTALEIADLSRKAGLDFLRGTGWGWGQADLAVWVASPYRRATNITFGTSCIPSFRPTGKEEEGEIERVLLSTRERLLATLAVASQEWAAYGFAEDVSRRGLVIGVQDGVGSIGYVAVDRPGMSLFDRVWSLFVADYLTRPRDYDDLSLCDHCGEASFAWAPAHHRHCEAPPLQSDVVRQNEDPAANKRWGNG